MNRWTVRAAWLMPLMVPLPLVLHCTELLCGVKRHQLDCVSLLPLW